MCADAVVGLILQPSFSRNAAGESARSAVVGIARSLEDSGKFHAIDAADLSGPPDVELLIHAGRLFHEPTWRHVVEYVRRGGHLLSLGCEPFTIPCHIKDGNVVEGPRTDAALHALQIVDTCMSTGGFDRPAARDVSPRFSFLDRIGLPALADTCSMDVRLAFGPDENEPQYARHGVREADLEVGCRLYDDAGQAVAAPIISVCHFHNGRVTFLNFDPKDPGFYQTDAGIGLLDAVIDACFTECWHINLTSHYARYLPDERVELAIHARKLAGNAGHVSRRVEISLHAADRPDDPPAATHTVRIAGRITRDRFSITGLPEGSYRVHATLDVHGRTLQQCVTGFYVLSDQRAAEIASNAPRLEIIPETAPDYAVVDGRPFPMTGSTYMAPDNYRDCFVNLNVARARSDLARLRDMGVNIIRTGVWTTYGLIYQPDGGFRKEALRSMDAYFLAAAGAGLPVQFAPSAFVMNPWNREASPFHNPQLRAKCMRCFEQFAERYARWPGVQLDVINEPSYAPFKHGHLWQLARPFGDPHELAAWRHWLREHYADEADLRSAWGITSAELASFDDATLPEPDEFASNYDGPPCYNLRGRLADFYCFARDTWRDWMREIRSIVRKHAPDMLMMVGRDETLRVPSQQHDAFDNTIDIVNWHQWHREGTIFNEYVLNRIRGMVCCGQEMGVLSYKDQRNDERLSEADMRNQLERKLVYCLGNWIQWQSHSDPTMDTYKEVKLGLIRADGTTRPAAEVVRGLAMLESRMAHRLVGRREDQERVAIVVPTSLWFSSDSPLAYRAMTQSIFAMHNHLRRPAYTILEDLLNPHNRRQIGEPELVILPSATVLSEQAWQHLVRLVEQDGVTLLITGSIEQDEYWRRRSRMGSIGIPVDVKNLATTETSWVKDQRHDCTFRDALRLNLPGKALFKATPVGSAGTEFVDRRIGNGRLIWCPVPVELADSIEPAVALYRQVIRSVTSLPPALIQVDPDHDSVGHFICPIRYADCTAISLVNEGPDATWRFRLADPRVDIEIGMSAGRAAKLYIDSAGTLLGAYAPGQLRVGDIEWEPTVDIR